MDLHEANQLLATTSPATAAGQLVTHELESLKKTVDQQKRKIDDFEKVSEWFVD